MSRRNVNTDRGAVAGLYRDRENGWVFGVCAGIAARFDAELTAVRIVAVISLILFFWPTVLAYGVLALLLRDKPLIYAGRRTEFDFWRNYRHDRWSRS